MQHRGWISRTGQGEACPVLMFILVLMLAVGSAQSAPARTFTVLYTFSIPNDPLTTLVQDAQGNLYGTTIGDNGSPGSVFKLDTQRHLTVLHNFSGGSDGGRPNPELALDRDGNLYGTTNQGGAFNSNGVIFKLDKAGHETVLYNFCSQGSCADGNGPRSGVIRDANGNLYGTTPEGGKGGGVVFRLDPSDKYTVLYDFLGGNDGVGTPLWSTIDRHSWTVGTRKLSFSAPSQLLCLVSR